MEYVIEHFPNKDIIKIHLREKIKSIEERVGTKLLGKGRDQFLKNESFPAYAKKTNSPFLNDLVKINGIVDSRASFDSDYGISIEKATAFDWPPILEKVVPLVEKHFALDNLVLKDEIFSKPEATYRKEVVLLETTIKSQHLESSKDDPDYQKQLSELQTQINQVIKEKDLVNPKVFISQSMIHCGNFYTRIMVTIGQ